VSGGEPATNAPSAPSALTPELVAQRLEQVRALYALMLSLRAITTTPRDHGR